MRSLLLVALIALLVPHATGHHDGGNLVNAVVGNSLAPSRDINETERIRSHLLGVADRLVRADVRHLTHAQREARARNLVRLVQYAHVGRFPHKPASIPGRVPNFLDEDGARCAVGYLLEQDLGFPAVQEIAREHQFDYVPYIDSTVLAAWQKESGLTPVELAMIQPSYDYRDPERAALRTQFEKKMQVLENDGFTGQVLVARERGVVLNSAYGYAGWDGRHRVSRSTLYDIGSATEAFTALAIYTLIDTEKLRLSSTLGELFPQTPKDKRAITVEHLLGHTSGLGMTHAADGETNRDRAVSKLLAQPLASAPGTRFAFSDDGYVVLAAIIEVASRQSYEDYMWGSGVMDRERMQNTAFWGSAHVAAFSRPLDKKLLQPHWGQRGSGGILSNADGLYWWAHRFLHGHPSGYILEEITKSRVNTGGGTGVGYGWFWTNPGSDKHVLLTKGNEDFGHNALVAIYPNNAMLAVTSNRYDHGEPWSERVASELEPMLMGMK
jgi:CubicO group peptidase (beta-lactamase class C family)